MDFALFKNIDQSVSNIFTSGANSELITSIIGLEGVFLAVAAPLLLNTLVKSAEKYNDSEFPKVIGVNGYHYSFLAIVIIHLVWGLLLLCDKNIYSILPKYVENLINKNFNLYFSLFIILIFTSVYFSIGIAKMSLNPEANILKRINKYKKQIKKIEKLTFLNQRLEMIIKNKIQNDENESFENILDNLSRQIENATTILDGEINKTKAKYIPEDFTAAFNSSTKEATHKRSIDHYYRQINEHNQSITRNILIFSRLWLTALKANNDQALIIIAHKITQISKNNLKQNSTEWANSITNLLENIIHISKNYPSKATFASSLANHWYWYNFLSLHSDPSIFTPETLGLCKQSYLKQIFLLIKYENDFVNKGICRTIIEHGFDYSSKINKIYDISRDQQRDADNIRQIRTHLKKLESSSLEINDEKSFKLLTAVIDNIKNSYEDTDQNKEVIKDLYKYANWCYNYSSLQLIHFYIAALAIFLNRPSIIEYMWNFKQPHDSNATWCGPDIIPTDIQNVIDIYFYKIGYENCSHYFGDHHSSEMYFKQYFILLLIKNIKNTNRITIKSVNPHLISHIIHQSRNIIKHINDILPISLFNTFFSHRRYNPTIYEIKQLLSRLEKLSKAKLKTLEKSTPIDQSVKNDFVQSVIDGYSESFTIKKILSSNSLIKIDSTPNTKNNILFGMSYLQERATFFKNWHISYSGNAQQYGENIGRSANKRIINDIIKTSNSINGSFIDAINKFDKKNIIIIASGHSIHQHFKTDSNFKYTPDNFDDVYKADAEYVLGDDIIPIYRCYSGDNGLLIIAKDQQPILSIQNPKQGQFNDDSIFNNEIIVNINDIDDEKIPGIIEYNRDKYVDYDSEEDIIEDIKLNMAIDIYIKFELHNKIDSLYLTNNE